MRLRRRGRTAPTSTACPPGGGAANAVPTVVVDFVGDPANDRRFFGLAAEVIGRAQGGGQTVYMGMNGDPSTTFNGYGPALQTFTGAAAPAWSPNVYGDPLQATMENGLRTGEGPYADPVRRMLAQRLARRR